MKSQTFSFLFCIRLFAGLLMLLSPGFSFAGTQASFPESTADYLMPCYSPLLIVTPALSTVEPERRRRNAGRRLMGKLQKLIANAVFWQKDEFPDVVHIDFDQSADGSVGEIPIKTAATHTEGQFKFGLYPTHQYKKVKVFLLTEKGRYISILHKGRLQAEDYVFEWRDPNTDNHTYIVRVEVGSQVWMHKYVMTQ